MNKPAKSPHSVFAAIKGATWLPNVGRVQMRFAAIWLALVALLIVSGVVVPRSLLPDTILAILPLAAFLAIAAMGQSLVLMMRGIDLSVPAIITCSSTLLLGISGGSNSALVIAILVALAAAATVGLINGLLVTYLKLNALIVTLATGAILSGVTLSYRQSIPTESSVPPLLANWGDARVIGLNVSVWIALLLTAALTVVLRKTTLGRHFSAVGANPGAAHIAGLNVSRYQIAAYSLAGFLYGVVGILASAFIRNPTLDVGNPYLLAPIAAAVLGGTAMSGGIGSMISIAGAALFLTHLGQSLRMLGLATSFQMILEGAAIALGMGIASFPSLNVFRRKQRAAHGDAGHS